MIFDIFLFSYFYLLFVLLSKVFAGIRPFLKGREIRAPFLSIFMPKKKN